MKKTLCSLLIVAIIMNFIMCNKCYAEKMSSESGVLQDVLLGDGTENTSAVPSNTAAATILEDGLMPQKNGEEATQHTNSTSAGVSMIGVIMGYLALLVDAIPLQFQMLFSAMTITESDDKIADNFFLTIEKIVFNKVALFNVNYFDDKTEYTVGSGDHAVTITHAESNLKIKTSVSQMFIVCRLIAVAIGLLVLIYIGIRMALSTIASEEAKYKKMLVAWGESIILMFVLVYIMVFIMSFGEMLVSLFYNMRCDILENGKTVSPSGVVETPENFETTIVSSILDGILTASGLRLAMYSLMYWALVYSQFKFFYLYIKRLLAVGFLIMISPLITITYSIDKAGDGRAQAFSMWFKEFVINVLIQPLHALIYLVFMFTAGEIAKYAPIVGLAFMLSMGSVERMVKVIFDMGGMTSLRGVDKFRKKG